MSRTRRFLGGLVFGYANQALVTLVGLWLTAFLLQQLGQEDYGLWLVATQILGYVMLLDLGVVALLPREVAFATGRAGGSAPDADDLPLIVGRTARLVLWQLPAVAVVAVVVWFALPEDWAPLRHPLGLVLGLFVLGFPIRVFQALLNGLQELSYLAGVFTVTWLVQTGVTVALMLAGWGLWALAVGWAAAQALSWLLWVRRILRRYPQLLPSSLPRLHGASLRDRVGRSLWISLQQIAQVFLQGTDLIIVGRMLGPEAVVPYFCTAKVLTVLGHQPRALAQTAQPALSELRTSATREHLGRVAHALSTAILVLSGGIVCVVLVVNEGFVHWWVGTEQYGGFALTALLLAAMLLRHWNSTAVYSLFAFGHDRRIALVTLADGVVTVALTVALVSRFGLVGAALGSCLGVVLVGLPVNLKGLAGELGRSVPGLLADLWPWLWRFTLAAFVAGMAGQVWVVDTLVALVMATIAVGALYAALMIPLALREPLGTYVRPRLTALRRVVLGSAATGEAGS